MRTFSLIRRVGAAAMVAGWATFAVAADDSASRSSQSKAATTSAASRAGANRNGAARGPLPDPALLDGSSQPAEKRPEYGMIGDFEMPGDENAKSGKVGGQPNPNQQGAGGQQNNLPMGLPQMGGAGGQQQSAQGEAPQGAGTPGGQQTPQGAAPQTQSGGNAGAGDPGGQAQGIQVSEIGGPQGSPAAGSDAQAGAGDKPQAVAIGDKAMRIENGAPQAGVVGAQQVAGKTQQHEKGTGTGGKNAVGTGGPNRVEKGRAIPAGL
ncbi:MAG: hypothetical protein ABIQ12_10735 [Opitutaceae bacterium]